MVPGRALLFGQILALSSSSIGGANAMTQTFCGWAMLEPDARRPLRVWMRVGRGPGRASARAFTGGALASGTLAGAMIPRRRCCRRPHPTILAAATLAAAGCRSLSVAGPRRTPSSLPRLRRPAVLAPRPPPLHRRCPRRRRRRCRQHHPHRRAPALLLPPLLLSPRHIAAGCEERPAHQAALEDSRRHAARMKRVRSSSRPWLHARRAAPLLACVRRSAQRILPTDIGALSVAQLTLLPRRCSTLSAPLAQTCAAVYHNRCRAAATARSCSTGPSMIRWGAGPLMCTG